MGENEIEQSLSDVLGNLIAFDSDDRAIWPQQELHTALRVQLSSRIPMRKAVRGTRDVQTFGDLLRHPSPPLELLHEAKEYAKRRKAEGEGVAPEICLLMYYGSIAAAMVRRNERITSLSDDDLRDGLNWVVRQPWVDEQTRGLFVEALGALRTGRHRWRR